MIDYQHVFSLGATDRYGEVGLYQKRYIGTQHRHTITQKVYTISDVVWIGDTDEWGFEHIEVGSTVKFVRSIRNFFGIHDNGAQRFIPIEVL